MQFEAVIGLEIHAQLLTKTKLFCGCRSVFGGEPNSRGCPVCLGLPGALPALNREAVAMAIRAGSALGCVIAPKSVFSRKHYFYPDLPKGYQISQYDMPLCANGRLEIAGAPGPKTVRIRRIHLEEDAGKLVHDQGDDSLLDVNRCGTPLIEIVSEPDLSTPQEAYAFLIALKQILAYLDICDCSMAEGSLRCDANVSVRPAGGPLPAARTELKNMNTFRGVEKALQYEITRQIETIASGGTVAQQTLLWDPDGRRTEAMRDKEDARDYRYFPDPDLVPLVVDRSQVEAARAGLPELPQARRARFERSYALAADGAEILSSQKALGDYFEEVVACGADARTAAAWVMGEVLRIASERKTGIWRLRVTPRRLACLLAKVGDGAISALSAKRVLAIMEETDRDPDPVIRETGLQQISDAAELEKAVSAVIDAHPSEAARFRGGEHALLDYFVGQAMKALKGRGNPKQINRIANRLLERK